MGEILDFTQELEKSSPIKINPDFKDLLKPLTEHAFETLEKNILSDGCRDAWFYGMGLSLMDITGITSAPNTTCPLRRSIRRLRVRLMPEYGSVIISLEEEICFLQKGSNS